MTYDESDAARFRAMNALLSREPGYSVAAKCLEVQAAAEARDPTLRTETRVRLADDAWSWYVGACGEREVGALLARLGPEWMVRHAVPIGSGTQDIDHLVIGPTGAYAINTKHHRDAKVWIGDHVLRLNNVNTRHVSDARRDQANAVRRLSEAVGFPVSLVSVIALVGEQSIVDGRRGPRNAPAVVSSRQLLHWITSQRSSHTASELGLIRLAAEEPRTWHVDPSAADTLRVMRRFDRLVSDVGAAPNPHRPQRAAPAVNDAIQRPVRSPRPVRSTRRPSARAQARRREQIAKLVMLAVALLTWPAWGPALLEAFTTALTAALTPGS